MNLDLDDPLGDLLSDGSNDSFFGIEPVKKPTPKIERKDAKASGKKMEQLFGIEEEKREAIKTKSSELKLFSGEITSPAKSLPKRSTTAAQPEHQRLQPKPQNEIETKSNDSLTSELGFDPKKPRKKGNILDELLGIGESSLSTTKSQLSSKPTVPMKATISRQTTSETISENINYDNPSAARKTGRRQSAVVFSDPLGLFGPNEKEKEQIKKVEAKTTRKSNTGSEWLFNDPTQDKSSTPLTKLKSSPAIHVTENSDEKHEDEPVSSNVTSLESKNTLTSSALLRNQPQIMETLVNETANTLNNLKQQEFQLMVATQMKSQENVLMEMKNRQQELLKQQELQFNELLKKQITRQSELEGVIKNQQERINDHIQALLASHAQAPFLDNLLINKPPTENQAIEDANPHKRVELEADVKRLEMEKLRLEDMLSNISDNHEKEIIMIERSYKKRLQLMEENLESMEQRYKAEIAAVEKFFSDKIKSISDERESNLEALKLHYEEMMQNIRKSKFMEFAIKEESISYFDILKRASTHLEVASGDVHSLHEVLQEKLIVLERDKEIQLNMREKRLEGNICVLTIVANTFC
ncbi:CLUMA_CG001640, isoform A [Clunio marinus]|uniref:CLUMA_CG001640, isoform A n=1 Tax=Clunio marinus TaxID=568069 RepID=A0A1J1HIL5_9DIPT|nr:CLUMA_CG001640, isoform A [Clunio marinus]